MVTKSVFILSVVLWASVAMEAGAQTYYQTFSGTAVPNVAAPSVTVQPGLGGITMYQNFQGTTVPNVTAPIATAPAGSSTYYKAFPGTTVPNVSQPMYAPAPTPAYGLKPYGR